MENLIVHPNIATKLKDKHKVEVSEVEECFANVTKGYLIDTQEDRKTNPPTRWFIEETNKGRKLLVAFIHFVDKNKIVLKTAFKPNAKQIKVYRKLTSV
jgi:hypothetical protein